MKLQLSLALPLGLVSFAGSAQAQVVVDGTIAGDAYGAPKSVQLVQTQFGDNASELDAGYCVAANGRMYLAITGNIEDNFNKMEILIDSRAGGENVYSGIPGNDNTGVMAGLTFDAGFEADYHVIVRRGNFGGDKFDLDIAELGTPNFSAYPDVFGGTSTGSGTTGTGPANASPIDVAYDNSNVDGIIGGCDAADQAAAAAVLTGVELGIALSDLGDPAGDVRFLVFVNGSNHDFASNQFLGGLAPPQCNLGGDGLGNFTGALDFDLNDFPGEQFFTCAVGAPPSDVRLNELYISHSGTDDMEYVELVGPPGASLDTHAVLVVEGDSTNAGTLDRVWDLSGLVIPASGYFVLGDTAVAPNDFDLGASNTIENGTETIYLVQSADIGALSALLGMSVDPDGDLITDIPTLSTIVDIIGVIDGGFPATDFIYDGAATVGPDGTFLPAGIFRGGDFPSDWCGTSFLDFDDVANMDLPRTPGAMNVDCPPPCTDDCACPTIIAGVGMFPFDTTGATTDGSPDVLCDKFGTSQIENDVWFSWTPDEDCDYTISTCGQTSLDTKIAIYDGADCVASSVLDCNDDAAVGCGLQSEVFASGLIAGNTYLIRIGSFSSTATGSGTFSITSSNCAPNCSTNDDCACAEAIAGTGTFNFDNSNATTDGAGSPLCYKFGSSLIDNDVWFAWTAPDNCDYTVSTIGLSGGVDTKIAIYDGADCVTSSIIDCNDDTVGLESEVFAAGLTAGTTYLIEIGTFPGASGGVGQFSITESNCVPTCPDNDDCACAEAIAGTGTFNFDNSTATTDGGTSALCYKFGSSQVDNDVWYSWTAPCNGDYVVSTVGLSGGVDTKIAIYDGADCATSSITDCNDDTVGLESEVTGTGLVAGNSYLIRIGTFPGASGGVGQFSVSGQDVGGTNYCEGGMNGDGQVGSMSISGSTSVAANDLVLVASDLTDASFAGLFVMGDTQDMLPFASGFLCIDLSGTFIRLNPIINGGGDVVSRAVDNSVAPSNVITPGSTWNFQYWYRDQPIFATNFTDGISVCFAP